MNLHEVKAPVSNRKNRKRIGRGQGSGTGGTAGRGHKGQKSRSGAKIKAGFEGGQMPLQRRIPKFGFKNPFRAEYQPINIGKIAAYIEAGKLGSTITFQDLVDQRLADRDQRVKLLGTGDLEKKIEIEVHSVSESARKKVEEAGGKITEI